MPSSWRRAALLWCLLLALPFQAVAAVGMRLCADLPTAVAAVAGQAHLQHANHVHEPAHDHGLSQAPAEAAAAAGPGDPHAAHEPGQVHKCSVCASCCSGWALISTAAVLPTAPEGRAVFTAPVCHVATAVVDGLERPPRALRS